MVDKFKPVKIKNVDVVYADKPGRNRNVYSATVLKEAISYYKKLIKLDPTYRYSFAKHPKDNDEEWIGLIAAAIDDIYFNDAEGTVQADFTLLPTIWGQFISWLIENDYHVGISLRGKAESQSASMEIGGSIVPIKQRFNLRLEGVDFVVYPSYIVTHASKENISEKTDGVCDSHAGSILPQLCSPNMSASHSQVLEHFIQDTSNEYGLPVDDIRNLLTTNKKSVEETPDMDELQIREAQVLVDRLTIDKDKLTAEIAAIKNELDQHSTVAESKRAAIAELDTKIAEKQKVVTALNQLEERLKDKDEELQALESKITNTSSDLEKLSVDYKDLTTRAEKQTVVRLAGRTFSSDTVPSIRVLEVAEKTTGADWSHVQTDKISQIVALTKDEELAKKVFAVVENTDSWKGLKLPVYQAFKSEAEGYDIDLVLNSDALESSIQYLSSRKGIALDAQQKTSAFNFLHSKYSELETTGMHEVPASLKEVHKRAQVLEKISFDTPDTFAESVIESAILHGIVIIGDDKVTESANDGKIVVNRAIAYDNLSAAVMNTLLGINRGKVIEAVMSPEESTDMLNTFVNTLVTSPDGSPTDFSEAFGIETVEEFTTKYVGPLNELLANNDMKSALGMIQMAVAMYTQAMVDASDNMNVSEHINTAFQAITSAISPASDEELVSQEDPTIVDPTLNANPVQENTTTQIEEGADEMLFTDLKAILEKRFEGVTVADPAELTTVVEKLITDYEQTFAELRTIELSVAKKDKVAELSAAGVTEEVIESELSAATDIATLTTIAEKLLSTAVAVTESTIDTTIDPLDIQKSHAVVIPESAPNASMDMFKKILNAV